MTPVNSNQARFFCALLSFSLFCFSATCLAVEPNEKEAVTQAAHQLYRALSAKDSATFSQFIPTQGFTEINPDWDGTRVLNMTVFNSIFQSGAQINLYIEDLQVQMLNPQHAIVTGYRSGTISGPDAKPVANKLPLTMIWQSEDGSWKLKHVHLSKSK